jgi:hypothetical protein
VTRLTAVAVVWLVGLAAGLYGLLAATAHYGCTPEDRAVACGTTGSIAGILVMLLVIAVVAAVTLATRGRSARGVLVLGVLGLVVLVGCLLTAHGVLATA